MVATKRLRGTQRRDQILTVARRVFAEVGYEDASIDDVAAAAGVTKPVVYRHFAGKRDLYLAVLEAHLSELIRTLWVALSSSPDPRARLRAGLEAYFDYAEHNEEGFRMLFDASTR